LVYEEKANYGAGGKGSILFSPPRQEEGSNGAVSKKDFKIWFWLILFEILFL